MDSSKAENRRVGKVLHSFLFALAILICGCDKPEPPKEVEKKGDPYVGEWSGAWFDEGKGEATANIRKDNEHYIAEIRDAEGHLITILNGKPEERGLEFLSSDDAPDRYLSLWHGLIEEGQDEFVANPHPIRDYQGFSMTKKKEEQEP